MPQSSTLFEIMSTEEGLRFQGRNEEDVDPDTGIDIPRNYYPKLFKALVVQAQMGLGRTLPIQHLEILQHATKILIS